MLPGFKKFFGVISVEVKKGVVTVEGVPADVISDDIYRLWKTSRVTQNLFIEATRSSFSFHEFFCIEVVYALNRIISDRKTRANRHTLGAIVEKLETETWLNRSKLEVPKLLNREKIKELAYPPLKFQEGFFDAYEQNRHRLGLKGGLLAGAAGSGKTYISLALMAMREVDMLLVVAPLNSLNEVWENNVLSVFKVPPKHWVSNSGKPPAGDEKVLIVNYEYLKHVKKLLAQFKFSQLGIVLDESHNFNEMTAQRTLDFIELCNDTGCEDVLWDSGTPIKAIAVEAIPLIRCIDPMFTPDCEKRFKAIYGASVERATDMLAHRISGLMYKIEKKELGLLPPIFREVKVKVPDGERFTLARVKEDMVNFTDERNNYYALRRKADEKFFYDTLDAFYKGLNSSQRNEYTNYMRSLGTVRRYEGDARFCKEEMMYCNRYEARQILPTLGKADRDKFREVKTIVKYVKLKIQGECLGRVVGRARIDAHLAMATQIDYVALMQSTEKKTLVYTSFVEVLELLKAHFKELGLSPIYVYAETNKNLPALVQKFREDETANPLVATYKSLSTAVPLTMADVMLLIDSPWRDYQLQQTVSRISRLGSTTQTYVYTSVLDTGEQPNISTRSVDILKWSQVQIAAITGITSPFELTDDMEQADLALEGFVEETPTRAGHGPSFLSW